MTKLYRSTRDKVMTGLTGGLSETLGIDSTLARILLVVSVPFTGGTVIPLYFIAALVIPKEPTQHNPFGPGPGAYGGYYSGQTPPHYDKNHAHTAPDSGLDAMMKDIEKKAMRKEIEELKQKLSKYEKGEV